MKPTFILRSVLQLIVFIADNREGSLHDYSARKEVNGIDDNKDWLWLMLQGNIF